MEAELPGRLATLRRLTAGDPAQSARAAELERLIAAYDAYAEREVAAGADRPRAALVTAVSGAAERLDGLRARQIDTRLLFEVRDRRARVVVVDVTGVPEIDTPVANQLLQTVTSVRLLGARVIMTGVSGELAQALVGLDIDFARLESYGDLQRGVESATGRD